MKVEFSDRYREVSEQELNEKVQKFIKNLANMQGKSVVYDTVKGVYLIANY